MLTTDKLIEGAGTTEYNRVPQQLYTQLFGSDVGQRVIDDLVARYYAIQTYKKGDSHETAFREGHRQVIQFIISQISQGENPPTSE